MIRFALIAASTLGFFLTAALGNLMVPLLRAFQGRWDEPKARQAPGQEAPDAEPAAGSHHGRALPDGGGAGCCGRGLDCRLCGSA